MLNIPILLHLKQLLNLIKINKSCLICKTSTTKIICNQCHASFPELIQYCNICGIHVPTNNINICGKCNTKKPLFNCCIGAYAYDYPIKQIIHLIKYQSRHELIKPLTNKLATKLNAIYSNKNWPQAIIPVPMHKNSLNYRGFDQVLMLAKCLVKNINNNEIILAKNTIYRKQKTLPQHLLTVKERNKNIRGVFCLLKKIKYHHVAILDDVVTSSATVTEITKILKKSGVKTIDIWCLSRANLGIKAK